MIKLVRRFTTHLFIYIQDKERLIWDKKKKKKKKKTLYCVSQKERAQENQLGHILKCVCHIHNFIFDLVCILPWAVCVRKSVKLIKQFWRCGFDRGHKWKSEFRTFAYCRKFSTFVWAFKMFLYALLFTSPAGVAKIEITNRYLIKLNLLYDIYPRDTSIFEGVCYVGLRPPISCSLPQ